jgi:putative DNA primase/helicase
MIDACESAFDYAARSWPIFPTRSKRPLTQHGFKDATLDKAQIAAWWRQWPDAVPAIVTGIASGLVVLDIDIDSVKGIDGRDTLDAIGILTHPETLTAHTPRGGLHLFFRHPGHDVPNSAGALGCGLDVRGDGGYVVAPPELGRFFDRHLGLDTPLAPMPAWIVAARAESVPHGAAKEARQHLAVRLSAYCEAALDSAVGAICTAPAGQQRSTLNREVFNIGRLAGSGAIAPGLALDALIWAARQMPTYNALDPWRPLELDRIVNRSFSEGLRQPRGMPR